MEAFKTVFSVIDISGRKIIMTNKTWATTGWEAAEKTKQYLKQQGHMKFIFIKWNVLSPWTAHFK